jgi:hypothetical protein
MMNKLVKCFLLICLIAGGICLMYNEALSQNSGTDTAYVSGITAGRARSLIGGFIGLICLAIGWRVKSLSSKGDTNVRAGALWALLLGAIGLALSVMHLILTAGAVFGSGSGKAGAIVAIVLNAVGMVLAALALRKGNENGKR